MALLFVGRDGTSDALRKRADRHGYVRLVNGIYVESESEVSSALSDHTGTPLC